MVEDLNRFDFHRFGITCHNEHGVVTTCYQPVESDFLPDWDRATLTFPFELKKLAIDFYACINVTKRDASRETIRKHFNFRALLFVEAAARRAIPSQWVIALRFSG